MTARERLEGVVDLTDVASADFAVVHDLAESISSLCSLGDNRLANRKEVRTQATNQPLFRNLVFRYDPRHSILIP
jgi:hypothetical protein